MPEPKPPRHGLQPSAVDPTELISRAENEFPESLEPTVIIRRDDRRSASSGSDRTVMMPPPAAHSRPVPERVGPRQQRIPATPPGPVPRQAKVPGLWQRLSGWGGGTRQPPSKPVGTRERG